MPTLATVNAQWTNGVSVADADLRRINAGGFVGDGTALGARGGIVRHGDTSLAVTVNGSDQITVQPGVAIIPSATALAGAYAAAFGAVTGPGAGTAIASRNSTNPRIDLVTIDMSAGTARIRTVDGTPSASPTAPALPSGSIELARLSVPKVAGGAVTVTNTFRTYATGLGGTLYVETLSQLPGSGNQKSQHAIALDTGYDHVWNGTAWVVASSNGWIPYTPTLAGAIIGNGTISGAYTEALDSVTFWAQLIVGSTTSIAASSSTISLPVASKSGVLPSFNGETFDVSAGGSVQVRTSYSSPTTALILVPSASAGGYDRPLTGTVPFAYGAGDRIYVSGTYQRA